jgi:MscS family membrane protein
MKILIFVLILFTNLFSGNINENNITTSGMVLEEVSDTLKVVSNIHEADSIFLYLLFKMNEGFKAVDFYFEFYGLDSAKLFLILIILGSSWLIRYLISKSIELFYKFFEKESEDLVYKLVESIKNPFLWFLIFLSIYWSVKVYYYPDQPLHSITSIFNTIHLLTFAWLVWNGISNFKVIYESNEKRKMKIEMVSLIVYTLKIFIIITVATITFYKFFPGTLAFMGGAGVGFAFLMKDSASDYISTVKLVFEKSFSVGDWIKIANYQGTIDSIDNWNVKIRAFDLALIVIPSSKIVKDVYINYGRRLSRRIKFDFYLPINMKVANIRLILNEIEYMLHCHIGISKELVLSENKKRNEILKRKHGLSDTIFVHLLDVQHGNKVNIYAFVNKDIWKFQRDVQQDVIFKIKEILEFHGCSMIIEAKYLQNPFEEKNDKQEEVLVELK